MLEISGYLRSISESADPSLALDENTPFWFSEIIDTNRILVQAAPGILSVIPVTRSGVALEPRRSLSPRRRNKIFDYVYLGNKASDYLGFCRKALDSQAEGIVLDIGGGSLFYGASLYIEECRSVVVVDRSLDVLKAARDQVRREVGRLPANIVFLQTDYNDLPFKSASFSVIIAMEALNVMKSVWELVSHCRRVLTRPGELFMTALVYSGRWPGDRKLASMFRGNELQIEPRTQFDLTSRLCRVDADTDVAIKGNVAYVRQCCRPDELDEAIATQAA